MPDADEPDPRFLGGETAVLTDASSMALVIAIGWKGECDIVCNVANTQAVEWLRAIADQIEAKPSNVVPR